MSNSDDAKTSHRDYRAPYTSKHPVPTVQEYKSFKEQQRANLSANRTADTSSAYENEYDELKSEDDESHDKDQSKPHPEKSADATNKRPMPGDVQTQDQEDTSQVPAESQDPRNFRKAMKRRDPDRAEREVTDPVTHLPVTIRDFTDHDLKAAGKKRDEVDTTVLQRQIEKLRDSLGLSEKDFSEATLDADLDHRGMERTFPPPGFYNLQREMAKRSTQAIRIFGIVIAVLYTATVGVTTGYSRLSFTTAFFYVLGASALYASVEGLSYWLRNQEKHVWEDEIWAAQRRHDRRMLQVSKPESTKWLNRILGSVWPLINPDVFASLVDLLEDVMQASLPRFVRMVSVDDLGQGSEPLRILGIKWLPRGAAAKSVSIDGKATDQRKDAPKQNAANANGEGAESGSNNEKAQGEEDGALDGGFEGEEGEFVNVEVAFAYRSDAKKKRFRDREGNAHLYMAFYLPGGIKFPVWVEVQGLVGTLRARLQLTPDPPFIAMSTITFLGQPKVDLSCVPLVKKGFNIMDLPFISNFVQSAVDAAASGYVAPKSLTLDLKSMLAGDDFKHDTVGRGVIVVRIKRAFDFKAADVSVPLMKKASSDAYVSVGWAKFGKPMFSTRVLIAEMHPYWQEETHLVVSPEELDADENLRLQLWDSDRFTADDDLGRIEIGLKDLMKNDKSNGTMWDRTDTFEALRAGETMPGRLEWSVGYYSKVKLMDYQVAYNPPRNDITTVEQLRKYSYQKSAKKLREANKNEASEIEQLKNDDFEERCVEIISSSVPSQTYPSGILSVQIHQITGLELETLNRTRDQDGGGTEEGEDESGEGLPDSYCSISINHQKVYRTRTKPKNSKPFFNAGTERFVRDWRSTTVFIAVRDARVHEDDPLLGIVHLQLGTFLRSKGSSRYQGFFPLTGGIGYGRIRVSIVFRSVQMQPQPQHLGWEWGTLEIAPKVECSADLPDDLRQHRIKFRTPLGKGKMYSRGSSESGDVSSDQSGGSIWTSRNDIPLRLPVRQRYSTPLVIEFRASRLLKDSTPAFAVLWLHDIVDEEDVFQEIPVFKGDLERAEANVLPQEEMGEKVGSLKVKMRFFRGIGKWHGRVAKTSVDVGQMMEVLQCARDNGLIDDLVGDDEWIARRDGDKAETGADDSDSGSSSDNDDNGQTKSSKKRLQKTSEENADAEKSATGFMSEIKGYNRQKDQLHERHRGIMQWKGPRILNSLKNKAEHTVDKIGSVFDHADRVPDLETEV